MSDRSQWKMLHLLYRYGKPALKFDQLREAGIDCYLDTIQHLVNSQVVVQSGVSSFQLSSPAMEMLKTCVVAHRRWPGDDLRVDYPECFVIMPFSESWSSQVYKQLIEPAVVASGFNCLRGDTAVRVGDLARNVWDSIMRAGIIIADVSAPNPNVFYELGLVHALGKDAFIIKQIGVKVPADFGGAHYYEYDLADLGAGSTKLMVELQRWAEQTRACGVRALEP